MIRISNKWPTSKNGKNVLFFAQALHELLDDTSWDNYRVYALDTISRLADLRDVAIGVEDGTVRSKYIQHAKDEALWSLNNDPVIERIFTDNLSHLKNSISNIGGNTKDYIHRTTYIIEKASDAYKKSAEELIIEKCLGGGRKRHEIRQIAACYCSYLVRFGYSKTFLINQVKEEFFTKNIHRITKGKLLNFFKRFNCERSDYNLYVKMKRQNAEFLASVFPFLRVVEKRQVPPSCITADRKFFDYSRKDRLLCMPNIQALDPYAARNQTQMLLTSIKAMAWIEPLGKTYFGWDQTAFAHKVRCRGGQRVHPNEKVLKRRHAARNDHSKERFAEFLFRLFGKNNLTKTSKGKFIRALNSYALALDGTESKSQLVAMWASLEALLTEQKNEPKVDFHMPALVATVCKGYTKRNFEAAYVDFSKRYKADFISLIRKEKTVKGDINKFAAVILIERNEKLRQELIKLIRDNPLAMYRVSELRNKFATPEKATKTINAHEKRIKWQIFRIYRTRNDIVHMGGGRKYIESLIINLDTYFSTIIKQLNLRLDDYSKGTSLSQIFADLLLERDINIKLLRETKRVHKNNLAMLLEV